MDVLQLAAAAILLVGMTLFFHLSMEVARIPSARDYLAFLLIALAYGYAAAWVLVEWPA